MRHWQENNKMLYNQTLQSCNNKRTALQFITALISDTWSAKQRGRRARHNHYNLSQSLGINGFSLLIFWWAGKKAECGFWTKKGLCRKEFLDCHRCQSRSDKVRYKCLESYKGRGQHWGGGRRCEGVSDRARAQALPIIKWSHLNEKGSANKKGQYTALLQSPDGFI